MLVLLVSLLILPLTLAQFPGGSPVGGIGSGIGGYGGGERNYYVIGRLVCGIQGAQGARVSLWQSRGGGQPIIFDEVLVDVSGTVTMKAELLGNDWVGGGDGILFMTITHHCNGNRRLNIALPPSYFNQGLVVVKTFDLGTINLEARYSEEGNEFGGARGIGFGRGGRLGGLGEFGGLAQPIL